MANTTNAEITSIEKILKESSKKRSSIFNFSKTYPAYIVLILFIIASFFVKWAFEQKVITDKQNDFNKAKSSIMSRFELAYQSHYQVLSNIKGLYDVEVQIVRDFFVLYGTVPVQSYKSILSLMSVPEVKPDKLAAFRKYVQDQGYYDYNIFPQGNRPINYPVEFIVPEFGPGSHLRGYDLSTNEIVLEKINKAKTTNTIVATSVFNVREPDTLGLYLIAPTYFKDLPKNNPEELKQAFSGVVVLELDIIKFFEQALGAGSPTDTSVIFECYQIDENNKEKPIFASKNADLLKNVFESNKSEEQLLIADDHIKVRFTTIPGFGGEFQNLLPLLAFIISLIISIAFFGFLLAVTTSRAKAIDLAERITRSQRRIVESSKDIIGVLDLSGLWKSINTASIEIFGISPGDVIGSKIDPLFVNENDIKSFYSIISSNRDRKSVV